MKQEMSPSKVSSAPAVIAAKTNSSSSTSSSFSYNQINERRSRSLTNQPRYWTKTRQRQPSIDIRITFWDKDKDQRSSSSPLMIRALPRTLANFLFSLTLTLFGTFVRIPFYDASRYKTNTIDWQIQQTLIRKTMVLCLFTITPIYREIFPIVPKTSHKHHEYHQKDYQCNHTYMYYKKIMFIVYDYPSL